MCAIFRTDTKDPLVEQLSFSIFNKTFNPKFFPFVVRSTRVHVVLTPGDSTLVKYVNSSSMVTCTPSLAQLKVRWISPSGHVVSPIITERIHAEYRGHGACD